MELLLKAANKTALLVILNICIGFGLSVGWDNNNLMNYWLIFALARYILVDKYYEEVAKAVMKQLKEKQDESNGSK